MNNDLRSRLARWGTDEPPAPDPVFAARLEQDLRSQAYFGSGAPTPSFHRGRRLRPSLVLAAIVIVAAAGILASRLGEQAVDVAVAEATQTDLVLPDGTTVTAGAGQTLDNGTRIIVGPSGAAVVGGVVLAANEQAEVVDGAIVVDRRAVAGEPTPGPAPTETTQRPTPTTVEPTSPRVDTEPPVPPVTRPPATKPPVGDPLQVALSVAADPPTRLVLRWKVSGDDAAIDHWEIAASRGDTIQTIATLRDPSARELVVDVTARRVDGLRVRARGIDGALLAESSTVAVPG